MDLSPDTETIAEIKRRIKISEVVGKFTTLKRIGEGEYVGLCPFHAEKTPSFRVHDNDGYAKCFGSCGVSGDVFRMAMELHGTSFKDTLAELKAEAGIEDLYLTKSQKKEVEYQRRKREQIQSGFRKWKQKLRSDLILYTNAQWRMYRIALRQSRLASSDELDEQIENHYREAVRREKALDELDSMSDVDLMEWYTTKSTWEGIKNPAWVLTGWRLEMARKAG